MGKYAIVLRVISGLGVLGAWAFKIVEWVNKPEEITGAAKKISGVADMISPSTVLLIVLTVLVAVSLMPPAAWKYLRNRLWKKKPHHCGTCEFCRGNEVEVMAVLTSAFLGWKSITDKTPGQLGKQRADAFLINQLENAIPPLLKKYFPSYVSREFRTTLRRCAANTDVDHVPQRYRPATDALASLMCYGKPSRQSQKQTASAFSPEPSAASPPAEPEQPRPSSPPLP